MATQINKDGINSGITWCDYTANLWWGCVGVSDGCDNCYAQKIAERFGSNLWGNSVPRKEIKSVWKDLDKYQKIASKAGEIRKVFVGSMMDIFEKEMPLVDSKGNENKNANTGNLRFHLFYRIDRGDYPNLMFLFLTKRETNINKFIFDSWKTNPPENVMFGASVVDQESFDRVTKNLQDVKGKKFLSIEPQLKPISLGNLSGIDWIIQGGESGQKRRPFDIEWARSMRDDCARLNIPYFFKQIDKVKEIPEDLLIRQFYK
jgi:protein gp37